MRQLRARIGAGPSGTSRLVSTDVIVLAMTLCLTLFLGSGVVSGATGPDQLTHNSTNTATGKYGTWGTSYTCTTCHSKSSTTNIKKIRTSIDTPTGIRPVIFDRITTSRNDVVGNFGNDERTVYANSSRNVCEVCHHQTIYHEYSSSKLSRTNHPEHKSNRKDCMKCHSHRMGFRPPQQGSCTDCHGNPPTRPSELVTNALGPNPPADAGAHTKHRLEEGMKCGTCHNGYGHGLLGNDLIEMGFRIYSGNWPNFTGNVTTGTITATNYVGFNDDFTLAPGNPGTTLLRSSAYGASCSIYCHGDNWNYSSGHARKTPLSWTNGPLGDCSNAVCHGTTPVNPPTPVMGSISTGAHKRHVAKNQYVCNTCHDSYPNPHMINGHVKWNLSSQGASATYKGFRIASTAYLATTGTYGQCNNIYCHSSAQSGTTGTGTPTYAATPPTWGGGFLSCNGCHSSPMTSGSHTKHTTGYNNRFICSDCHSGAGKDNDLKHADGNIDVSFSATYGGSYPAVNPPGNGYASCSATYCHSDGNGGTVSVTWGATVSCTSCHGGAAGSGSPIASGKHTQHVNNASRIGTNFGCVECHASTVSNDITVGNVATHVNKFKDYSGSKAGKNRAACNNAYCHSNGKGTPGTSVDWATGPSLVNCIGCHGVDPAPAFTSTGGEPNYVNAGAGLTKANSHEKHMGGTGPSVCVYCHGATATSSGTIVSASTSHINRGVDIAPGGGRTFTYGAGKTCSNISCHGAGSVSAQWGQLMPADCTGCHGNNASAATIISTGKHTAHVNNAAVLGTNLGCADCHAKTVSADRTISGFANHGNGFKDFSGVKAGGSSTYTTANGVCSATYCHTDGKGLTKPMTSAGWNSSTTMTCSSCHGSDPTPAFTSVAGEPNYATGGPGTLRANTHQQHVGPSGAVRCVNCHATTVTAAGTAIATGSAVHVDQNITVIPGNGNSFGYDAATKTCSTISCHGAGAPSQIWGATMPADCTGCHGGNASASTAISTGKHTAHINNAAFIGSNYGCADCHSKSVSSDRVLSSTVIHGNGFKDYSGVRAGKSSTYSTATGVCSASYCHTDGKGTQKNMTADSWNAVTSANCTRCHGSDSSPAFTSVAGEPNYANGGAGAVRANSHSKHMGGAGITYCAYCHSATMTTAGAIIGGSTTHTNKSIDIAPGGGRTFTYDSSTKTCSTISCHGAGAAAAQWGQTMPADCTGCHGGNATSSSPKNTGKHSAHMNNASVLGTNYGCVNCHALTVSADRTVADPAYHGNGFKNVTGVYFGARNSYSTATGVCSATYCHTDGKGTQKDMTSANWNSAATLDCKGCHGSDSAPDFASAAGEPNYVSTGAGTVRANSHKNHIDFGAASCVNCHSATTTTGLSITGSHTNRSIDVVPGNGKSFSYASTTKTCSTISCHGTGSVARQWGSSVTADCTGCHGNNTSSSTALATGKHTAHINNASIIGTNFGCAECHAATVSADRTFANSALHGNSFVDYSGARAGKGATYTSATGVCSATYCHTDGKGTVKDLSTRGWKSAATMDCTGCHGSDAAPAFTSIAGEPNYASAGGNQLRSNSHKSHASAGAATCVNCHSGTVTVAGTGIASGTSSHINRQIDVQQGGGNAFTWLSGTKSCSNISCHNNGSANWGDASTVGCLVCHPSLSGAHTAHVGDLLSSGTASFYNYTANKSAGANYRYGCANCHPTDTSKHRNGTVDVTLNKNKTGGSYQLSLNNLVTSDSAGYTKGGPSNFTCELAYCHSNGKSLTQIAGDYRQSPNWYGGAYTGNKCGMCHDNPPQYAGQSHYVPASSLGNNGTPPYRESGHMVGIHFRNNYKGNNANGFLGYSSSGDMAHGNPAYATTIACYICHNGIVSSTQIDTYAMNGTSSNFRCGKCHSTTTRTPLQVGQIVDASRHIDGKKTVVFSPVSFKTKAQLSNVANALGWTRTGAYKTAGSFDSFNLNVATWDPATKTCLTSCHVNQPNIIWGTALTCVSCHANQ